jgi:hypothetical protein
VAARRAATQQTALNALAKRYKKRLGKLLLFATN